ncbi:MULTISPECIES: flavodoxin [Ruoffia]|jgi:flavodoxin short chain|uniref:Flavodoxin n=2 Tax=Ruoffia TaxID=2862144 RepID=A0A839A269_9LACT|nr:MULTISPECIES: flavodoxin [Ruoffia]HBY90395.1 flavodoxin [Aerococcaceae bacterium]MBA5728286.1 flavodoxin [Ruoffia halotolerans]MBG9979163.1 flavodoxin [Ruoffia tabacinasalis]TLQ40306.1 flavodoxin [Ruoffia tabacinasalis]HJG47415.1 flavodoxin [Ruoffia tabacinasalis]
MAEALIIYTSLTGNTEACAEIVSAQLEEHGIDVTMEDVMLSEPEDFLDYDIVLVGSYTYGVDGVLPDEMEEFHEELAELDLSGKVYGVFGSGDDFYPVFCSAVDDFEEQFEKAGAVKGGTGVKVNLYPEEEDEELLKKLADDIVAKYEN